jgi:protein-S-isoprenylcysteine O-methyltransferase Ste14
MSLDLVEGWIGTLGAIAGLASLAYAILSMFSSLRRPSGREERGARLALRSPVLAVATVLFVLACAVAWRPLPTQPPFWLRITLLVFGAPLFFGSLTLYLWGLRALGEMFGPSSGFGVRLYARHRLVTRGPYAYIRHPMYLGVIGAAIGSLLLYRTWAALALAIMMFGTVVRARREETILSEELGAKWEAYASEVPPWLPRLGWKRKRGG